MSPLGHTYSIATSRAARLARWMGVTAGVATMLAPARAGAREGEGPIGFDLKLRPPEGMQLARARHPKKSGGREVAPAPATLPAAAPPAPAASDASAPDLGFDLLGPSSEAQKPAAYDEGRVRLRRKLLTTHSLLGVGLAVSMTATVVVGQLNYSDRFGGGPSSARYERAHLLLAASTGLLFVSTGLLAILAPNPLAKRHQGLDRVLLHKIGMFTAAAGMATEIGLGIYTARREGYLNQESLARTHMAIGYVTLAATYFGVGSIIF
jgi:hypothetical protein